MTGPAKSSQSNQKLSFLSSSNVDISIRSSVQRSTILQNIENAFCKTFSVYLSMSLQQEFYKPCTYRCLNLSRLLTGTQSKLLCKQQDRYGTQKQSTQLPECFSSHVCNIKPSCCYCHHIRENTNWRTAFVTSDLQWPSLNINKLEICRKYIYC